MQIFNLSLLTLIACAHALPTPHRRSILQNESDNAHSRSLLTSRQMVVRASALPATSSASSPAPSSSASSGGSRNKLVVAHHMVGNTFPYTSQDWLEDIQLAHASGIDGFALNMGSDDWQPARVADAYDAANQSGLNFKMFLSFDMSSLPCSTAADAAALRSLVSNYSAHPSQLLYSRDAANPLPLVSTFSGETCTFGQGSVAAGWSSQFSQHPDLQGKMTFVPSFFIDPSQFSQFNAVMDGDFNWNGGWPVALTTASTGSSSTTLSSSLKNLLGLGSASNAIANLSTLLSETPVPNSQTQTSATTTLETALSNFIGSTESDQQHLNALSSISTLNKRQDNSTTDKVYIAAVSPWFFTHFGKDTFNKNFMYLADQHLYAKRWETLIAAQKLLSGDDTDPTTVNGTSSQSQIADDVDIVEIISWNDYGESHYVGPIKGALPQGSEQWTNGMNHSAWLSLTSYYAAAFKTGSFPSIAENEETLLMWSRTHPADATATSDSVGTVPGGELAQDSVWAVALLSAPANITLEIYPFAGNGSSNVNTSSTAIASQTFSVPAGLNKLSIPISVPNSADSVSMRGTVQRGDDSVINLDAGDEGFLFVKKPQKFNFNAWVGCAGACVDQTSS